MNTKMEYSKAELDQKVLSYEKFVNDTLKSDLKKVLDQRDVIYAEIAEYLALKNTIEAIDVSELQGHELKTKMDLGCNFYCQAQMKVLDQRDVIYAEIAEYLALKNTIEAIDVSELQGHELKTKMDLGCNFYCQAQISDPSKIFVGIGYGIHLQMCHTEALAFIEKKTTRLTQLSKSLTSDASKIKAHIRLVLGGLQELQGIKQSEHQPHRNIWDT